MKRLFRNENGKKWEKPGGNPMGMGIGYKIGNGKKSLICIKVSTVTQ